MLVQLHIFMHFGGTNPNTDWPSLLFITVTKQALHDCLASITRLFFPLTSPACTSDPITAGLLRHGDLSEMTNHDRWLSAAPTEMTYDFERSRLTRWQTLEFQSGRARVHPKWHVLKYWRSPGMPRLDVTLPGCSARRWWTTPMRARRGYDSVCLIQ